jgi:hypothetical protein
MAHVVEEVVGVGAEVKAECIGLIVVDAAADFDTVTELSVDVEEDVFQATCWRYHNNFQQMLRRHYDAVAKEVGADSAKRNKET